MVKMREKVIEVTKRQYLSDPVWRKKIFRNSDNLSDDDIVSNFCFGCNFPPSQFQLHLQSMYGSCPYSLADSKSTSLLSISMVSSHEWKQLNV